GSIKEMISKESQRLNRGVAATRETLKNLLEQENPSVPTKGGGDHTSRREHLEEVAEVVPSYQHSKLRLPVFMFRTSDVKNEFYVEGELEAEVVKGIGDMEGWGMIDGKLWVPHSIGFRLHSDYNDVFQLVLLP
ncbi:MAG: DUF61 family protein, partial [Halobacteriaceae archaeon]